MAQSTRRLLPQRGRGRVPRRYPSDRRRYGRRRPGAGALAPWVGRRLAYMAAGPGEAAPITASSGMTLAVSGSRLLRRHRSARWTTWPQYWITAVLIGRSWLGTAAVAARRWGLRSPTRPASAGCC